MRRLVALGLTFLALVAALAAAPGAGAQSSGDGTVSGPTLTLNVNVVDPGGRVDVILTGWKARYATLAVCGNDARRGSADCNMVQSTGVRLTTSSGDLSAVHDMVVPTPPVDCPCVIRAVGGDSGEVATTPVELVGHPVSSVVTPELGQPVVNVALSVEAASDGPVASLRQALGGDAPQEVTVAVRNLTAEPVSDVAVHGRVQRRGTTVAEFDLEPGPIGPGQTWTGSTEVELSAPSIGEYQWEVTASGAGPVMATDLTTRQVPWPFVVLLLTLVGVLTTMAVRTLRRRSAATRALPAAGPLDGGSVIDITTRDELGDGPAVDPSVPAPVREPVGVAGGPSSG